MKKLFFVLLAFCFPAISYAITFPIDEAVLNIKHDHVYISGWYYEQRASGLHRALDIPCPENSIVRAPESGIVVSCNFQYYTGGEQQAYGNYVIIRTDGGEYWLVAHLQSYQVREGDRVAEGQAIARSGWTGLAKRQPHLHLEKRNASGFKVFFTNTFGLKFRLTK